MEQINNDLYDQLMERWYEGNDDPVALLRAEARFRNPWVQERILGARGSTPADILDVGCGGGLLSNYLTKFGHRVTGIDSSQTSLEIARKYCPHPGNAEYVYGNAYDLPFAKESFDVACAMDFLEHVKDPERAVSEIGRVLRPGGLFFFYTFNRNPLARLVVIKGLEWFVRNTPPHLHVYELFIKPRELHIYCLRNRMRIESMTGMRPQVLNRDFFRLLRTGRVFPNFSFTFCRSKAIAYIGMARKETHAST